MVMAVGVLFACYAGNFVADEDYTPIVEVIGGLVVICVFFGIGSSMYLLIPICWGLSGKVSALPLPFDVRQIAIIFASVIYISSRIFKTENKKGTFETIDIWIWINLGYLVTVFFRNPVGFAAIGGGARVGGKPYVDVILGVMAYLILNKSKISAKFSKQLPLWVLGISCFTAFAGAVQLFLPGVGFVLGKFYSGFAAMEGNDISQITAGETRFEFLTGLGLTLIVFIVSKINPTNLFRPDSLKLLISYLMGYIMIFLSGFRNAFATAILYTYMSALLRGKIIGFAKITFFILLIAISGILLSYTQIALPLTFQRTLSFLPGNWDSEAVENAKASNEWRFEMWEMALTSEKYIKNKIFGDGFGFLREDYERGIEISMGKQKLNDSEAQQEIYLLDGDYHSGPVGSIKFVGVVGLTLFLPLLYFMCKMAVDTIGRARGGGFEFCTYFYCIPIMAMPMIFIFVFGDYRGDLVLVLFNVGMMKMIRRSLLNYKQAHEVLLSS